MTEPRPIDPDPTVVARWHAGKAAFESGDFARVVEWYESERRIILAAVEREFAEEYPDKPKPEPVRGQL